MHLSDARLVPIDGAGPGRLVRFDGIVLLIGNDPSRVSSTALIELARHLRAGQTATDVLGQVEALLNRADGAELPAFAVLCQEGSALRIGVHGSVSVTVDQPAGPLRLGGGDQRHWGSAEVHDAGRVTGLLPSGRVVDPAPLVSLERGVAAASGFVLLPAGVEVADIAASPATPRHADVQQPLGQQPIGQQPLSQQPLSQQPFAGPAPAAPSGPEIAPPIADTPSLPAAVHSVVALDPGRATQRVPVRGVHCARGHFNDPRARYCAVCGISMLQASAILVEGERPPLGVLVFNSGINHRLSTNLVVGRDPAADPAVVTGASRALELASESLRLSRVHAELRLDGWNVELVDRGSTNGTFIWSDEAHQWRRLVEGQPEALEPGARIAFGDVTASFDSSINQ